MKSTILAVVVLAVGVAAFWGGGLYKEQAIRANPRALFSQGGFGGPGGQGAQGGGPGGASGASGPSAPGAPGGSGAPGGMFGGIRRDGQGAPGGLRGGASVLSGRLDEITDDELTLTTAFGSVTVKIDNQTKVKRAEKSDVKNLKVKEDVVIEGERDEAGDLTAKAVIQ